MSFPTMTRRGFVLGLAGGTAGLLLPRGRRVAAAWGTGQDWADYAAQFDGAPYVYAGDTPSGWDCSGFTMYVAAHFGVYVDHGSASQYDEGTPISSGDIQNGDFVYFQDTSHAGISHVGIVTDAANSVMINAENEWAGTTYADYSGSYWQDHWFGPARFWSDAAPAPQPPPDNGGGTTATTTANLRLRDGPGTGYGIILVMPAGATVTITGDPQDGFDPVDYQGTAGWASATYLSQGGGGGDGSESDIVAIIYAAADRYGQNREDMLRVARCESGLDPSEVTPPDNASGLFQFLPSTWASTPYANDDIFDAWASANAAGWMWSVGRRNEWVCQ